MRQTILTALTLSAITLATPAFAHHVPGHTDDIWPASYNNGHNRGQGHGKPSHAEQDAGQNARQNENDATLTIDRTGIRFSTRDLNVMIDWFKTQPVTQTKPSNLPPGLARQLKERGHLPPGLAMKALPPGLEGRLGPCPQGYNRVVIGNDIALINMATGLVTDILRSVIKD